jgi:uncharacterized protein YcbK (DUF882 family)
MGDLTKNISASELLCKCPSCEVRIQDHEEVIGVVQHICDHFAEYHSSSIRLEITSAARCREHNLTVGSNDESQHIRCSAMDIKLFCDGQQIPPKQVYRYADKAFSFGYGIGSYSSFTHIDTRSKKARW